MLANWFAFYHAYDPLFTWWVEKPYRALNTRLEEFSAFVRKEIAGVEDEDAIIGDPLGRDALREELNRALIPYSPEELITIGRKEMNWCLREMHRASEELGFGEDWRAAIEHVKTLHVPPGQQPALARALAREAEAYVQDNDLVTVPPVSRRVLAHGNDVTRTAKGQSVLSWAAKRSSSRSRRTTWRTRKNA